VDLVELAPGRSQFRCRCETPHWLFVYQSFHRGWRGHVDGRPCEIARANGDFMAVKIPAGAHDVDLRFDPDSLKWGIRISLVGLALGTVLALAGSRRKAAAAA
jgi:uncharacterized membrane protein YfhO